MNLLKLQLSVFLIFLSPIVAQKNLSTDFNNTFQTTCLQHAHIGVSIVETKTNKLIFEKNPTKWFSTASTIKLITTSAALEILGEDYKFETKIFHTGEIKDCVLTGNLIIKGSGDPTLGSSRYNESTGTIKTELALAFKKLNIKKIIGDIVIDFSEFDPSIIAPKTYWQDMGNYFSGAVWPINFDENLMYVTFKRENTLNYPTEIVQIKPNIPHLIIDNQVITNGTKDEAFAYMAPYSNHLSIKGTLPPSNDNYTIKTAHPYPPAYFTDILKDVLKNCKIDYIGQTKESFEKTNATQEIWSHKSPSLKNIIKETNQYSINLYAEAILRATGFKQFGTYSTENGIKAVKNFITTLNLDPKLLNMWDGSGISPANVTSPNFMTSYMYALQKYKWYATFLQSWSTSGSVGTLKNFGKNTSLENNFKGKSGNLDGISSYFGNYKNQHGQEYTICIFVNNFMCDNVAIKKTIESFIVKSCK